MEPRRHRVVEAILWCEYRLQQDADYRLRSDELRPRRNLIDLFQHEADMPYQEWLRWYVRRLPEVSSIIEEVIVKRSLLVHELGLTKTVQIPDGGKLLCYNPSRSTSDGIAPMLSERLFDRDDDPGWDSWVHYAIDVQSTALFLNDNASYGPDRLDDVVCWIPEEFVPRVEKSLPGNIDWSVEWLADVERTDKNELLKALE